MGHVHALLELCHMAREPVDLGNHARLTSPAAVRSACSCRVTSCSVVATNAYLQSAMDMLLSRKSLDRGTVADQRTLNNPLETLNLSRPPGARRVDHTETLEREGCAC